MNVSAATVVAVEGQAVTVRVTAVVACSRCAAGKGCGAGLLGSDRGPQEFALPLPSGMQLQRGDTVELQLRPTRLLQASFLAYGLPLVCMLLVPFVADQVYGPFTDLGLAGLAFTGLGLAVAVGRRYLGREPCLRRLVPGISRHPAAPL